MQEDGHDPADGIAHEDGQDDVRDTGSRPAGVATPSNGYRCLSVVPTHGKSCQSSGKQAERNINNGIRAAASGLADKAVQQGNSLLCQDRPGSDKLHRSLLLQIPNWMGRMTFLFRATSEVCVSCRVRTFRPLL